MAEKKSKPKAKINPKKTATGKANPKKGKPDSVEQLKNNLAQEQEKYLRLFAEFENFKKRTSRERIELFKTAGQEVISSLLPILDDFERALNNTLEQQNKEIEGFVLIQNKLNDIMKSNGLIATETKIADTFDAEIHEAITLIPAADAAQKGKIIDITEKGYQLGDKIIRFPKVVVGQ
ncbi:MAG: nucleotide exchange factor GrpE [Flavobacteriaceae bacterium]|nr:nucleotide exchange factor GrpE [Flavobacteriaceae bacterium]